MTEQKSGKLKKDDPSVAYEGTGGKPFHRCGVCAMYRQPNQCTIVAGFIRPYGHCKRFVKSGADLKGDKW